MPVRVSPTVRIRHHIDELFAQDRPLPEILEEVARLGAQLLMQAALNLAMAPLLIVRRRQPGPPVPRSPKTQPGTTKGERSSGRFDN